MRAVVVTEAGGPEVLRIAEIEEAEPGPGEVRVAVRAAGVNRADVLQRLGLYPAPPGVRPDVLGLELAGEVERVGPGVSAWKPGDRVMAIASGAAQAERVVCHERMLLPIPPALDFVQAAAIPEAFLTAHDALFRQAGLGRGEPVLIHAAGSGVGTAAMQLAHAGGNLVLGTSRTAEKLERARDLGLDHPLAVAPDGQFSRRVLGLTGGRGVPVIADFVGAAYLEENLRALSIGGRLVVIGLLGGARGEVDLGRLLARRLRLFGSTLRSRPLEEKIAATQAFAREGLPLLERGLVRPVVGEVLPVEAVGDAHVRMAEDRTFGKIVLRFDR